MNNKSEYPETFFTKKFEQSTPCKNCYNCNNCKSFNNSNNTFNLNNNLIGNLVQLLTKTNDINMGSLIKNLNPQLSQIFNMQKSPNNKNTTINPKNNENIIDISEFCEAD